MNTIHTSRIARAARAIAARLESEQEVHLYEHTARAEFILFRINHYLNRYCGSYYYYTPNAYEPLVICRKSGT